MTDPNGLSALDYVVGGLKVIGGFAEAAVGATVGAAASWTGVGLVAGGVLFLHGADVAATGARQLWYGTPQSSLTAQAVKGGLETVGVNPQTAGQVGEQFDVALSVGGTMGASAALLRAPMVTTVSAGSAGVASGETTTLFRSVSHAEYAQIMKTGQFEASTGSLGGKFFAETAADATKWGTAMEGAGNFRVVSATLPRTVADKLLRWARLDNIGPARYAELDQLKGAAIQTVK